MNRWLLWLPLALFGLFFAAFATGLIMPKDNIIESKMVGKPMPAFSLPGAVEQRPALGSADLAKGKPTLLNIFASWCVPCIAEAPHLLSLQQAGAEINAIASRKVQLEPGSSGVPETFVIDGNGIIVHQHIGDIREEDVPKILKLLEDAK